MSTRPRGPERVSISTATARARCHSDHADLVPGIALSEMRRRAPVECTPYLFINSDELIRRRIPMRWTKEEEILVSRLYLQVGRRHVRPDNSSLIELSKFLRRASVSISMRTGNFVAADTQNLQKGLNHPSKQTQETWRKFCDNSSFYHHPNKSSGRDRAPTTA